MDLFLRCGSVVWRHTVHALQLLIFFSRTHRSVFRFILSEKSKQQSYINWEGIWKKDIAIKSDLHELSVAVLVFWRASSRCRELPVHIETVKVEPAHTGIQCLINLNDAYFYAHKIRAPTASSKLARKRTHTLMNHERLESRLQFRGWGWGCWVWNRVDCRRSDKKRPWTHKS